jgi:two-component system, sensor histidine kinase and response regulator
MAHKIHSNIVLNILSLEDSVKDFELISEKLIDDGYNMTISRVESEHDFVDSIRNNKYDIILADFKLPEFDAFEALRLCNEICPNVPFICISGTVGEETAIELIKQGAVDYVLKDRLARLPLAVERALDQAKEKEILKQAEETIKLKVEELERFNSLLVGRELKMIDLKKEVNELLIRLGEKEKYKTV